jgi:ketosteroid isomerase-like protein
MSVSRIAIVSLLLAGTVAAQKPAKRPAPRPPARAEAQRQASQAEDREAIEQLHQDDIAGSLAFDIDKLTSTWDDEVVSMPPNSKPIVGKPANHEYLETQRKAMANVEILSYEETWDEVRVMGDYAYEYGSIRSRIRQPNAKDETALEYNIMRVLKKQPSGAWKIYRTIWNDRKAGIAEKDAAK